MRGSAGDGMPKLINLGITGSVEVGITGLKNGIGDPVISHFKKLLIMQ